MAVKCKSCNGSGQVAIVCGVCKGRGYFDNKNPPRYEVKLPPSASPNAQYTIYCSNCNKTGKNVGMCTTCDGEGSVGGAWSVVGEVLTDVIDIAGVVVEHAAKQIDHDRQECVKLAEQLIRSRDYLVAALRDRQGYHTRLVDTEDIIKKLRRFAYLEPSMGPRLDDFQGLARSATTAMEACEGSPVSDAAKRAIALLQVA